MDEPERLQSTSAVTGSDTLVVEFTLDDALVAPKEYLDTAQAGRNSLYGTVESVSHQTGLVRLSSEHAFEPVDIDFGRGLLVDAVSSTVLGRDIDVYDYDEVTTGDDPAVEPSR